MSIEVRLIMCMEVEGKRYGSAKTAALAIARAIANNLVRRWVLKNYDQYGRNQDPVYTWYTYKRKMTRKAYRRIKARVAEQFANA